VLEELVLGETTPPPNRLSCGAVSNATRNRTGGRCARAGDEPKVQFERRCVWPSGDAMMMILSVISHQEKFAAPDRTASRAAVARSRSPAATSRAAHNSLLRSLASPTI